jgi:hypothetical protein
MTPDAESVSKLAHSKMDMECGGLPTLLRGSPSDHFGASPPPPPPNAESGSKLQHSKMVKGRRQGRDAMILGPRAGRLDAHLAYVPQTTDSSQSLRSTNRKIFRLRQKSPSSVTGLVSVVLARRFAAAGGLKHAAGAP